MSKFSKALEQAQRERALAAQGRREPVPPPPDVPTAASFRRPASRRPPVEVPEGVDHHLVSLVEPAAFEAEQYRALRYLVEQKHRTDNLTVIAVSSAAVGDGKTTTAVNLAGALAQAPEARVLLVEADLRRPSIAQLLGFGGSARPGLVDAILNPNLALDQVVLPRPPFNLNVVLAGQAPPSPYEVLKAPRLAELLEEARQQYDFVIVDTPPMVSYQDSRVIARWVDGIILVVSAHRTPRRLVEEALNVVDPSKMLGFVFNGDAEGLTRLYSGYARHGSSPARGRRTGWRRGKSRREEPPE
jgi:capsular exopolysaccharide synthesis family protein